MNNDLSIDFIKENCPTIPSLKKRCDERRLFALQTTKPKMSSARPQNKLNMGSHGRSFKSPKQEPFLASSQTLDSLMPRTLNYTKVKQAKDDLLTQQAFKELGVEML